MNKKRRMDNDFYETPTPLIRELVNFLEYEQLLKPTHLILEPCVGDGSISKYLEITSYQGKVITNDIDIQKTADFHEDATSMLADCYQEKPDWIITNPPFNKSAAILGLSLYHAQRGVAMLLRLSFLEPTIKGNSRRSVLQEYQDCMRFIVPVNPRPCFRIGETNNDSVTVAWFVWDKQWSWKRKDIVSPFQFYLVDWRE